MGNEKDELDAALVIWAREIPDLDPLTEGIVERIDILAHALKESLEQTLAEYELDRRAVPRPRPPAELRPAVPALGGLARH